MSRPLLLSLILLAAERAFTQRRGLRLRAMPRRQARAWRREARCEIRRDWTGAYERPGLLPSPYRPCGPA